LGNKKAISPVVATVILVAVTIVVAVAVSYWMGSIAGLYTRFEKLEITSYTMTKDNVETLGAPSLTGKGWKITLYVKNSGSLDSTITSLVVNNKPLDSYIVGTNKRAEFGTQTPISVKTGMTEPVTIYLLEDDANNKVGFTAGTTIEVKLHTAGNMDFPQMMTLS